MYCYNLGQTEEKNLNEKKNDKLDKLLKEVIEEKVLDEYFHNDDDNDNENSDEYYEKSEHTLQKKSPFLFRFGSSRRRRSCPSAPSRCK